MNEISDGTSYTLSSTKFCNAGRYTSIAGGVRFHGPDNHPWVDNRKCVSNFPFRAIYNKEESHFGKGMIEVGNDVWICEGVRILSGVTIGDGAIIAAGAVVSKDVPPYALVVGNPARVKKYRFTQKNIKRLLKLRWWDKSPEEVRPMMEDMDDIDKFLEKYED